MSETREQLLGWLATASTTASTTIRDLPADVHLLAIAGVVVGLVMWLFGKRLLKPAFVVLGMFLGAVIGFVIASAAMPETIVGVPSIFVGLGVGAVLGLVQGLTTYRFAMAISAAVMLCLASTLGAAAWLRFEPLAKAAQVAGSSAIELKPALTPQSLGSAAEIKAAVKPVGEQVQAFVSQAADQLRHAWGGLQASEQTTIVLSGLGGAIVGVIFGLIFPTRASAGLTAMLGAAVLLPSAAWLLAAADAPGREHLPQSALVWLIVWLAVAAVGCILQLTVMNRRAKAE